MATYPVQCANTQCANFVAAVAVFLAPAATQTGLFAYNVQGLKIAHFHTWCLAGGYKEKFL